MFNRIKRWLIKQIQNNLMIYVTITIIFFMGIITGSIAINLLSTDQKSNIMSLLNAFYNNMCKDNFDNILILKQSVIDNYKTIGSIWIMGIIFIGVVFIPLMIVFRGFALGFTVGFLVNEYGLEGFLFSILGILPQNLLIIPGIITIASIGTSFSINNIKNKRMRIKQMNFIGKVFDYTVIICIFSVIVFIGCLIEAYVSPVFLKLIIGYN